MTEPVPAFEFTYDPGQIVFGRGSGGTLDTTLDEHGFDRALIACGANVGNNDAVMEPITTGLGDRLIGIFDETTPEKSILTILDGAEFIRETDPDVLIALGSGSTMNVTRGMAAVAALDADRDTILETTEETGSLPTPPAETDILPIVVVPTTLAGADISPGGGVGMPDGSTARLSDDRLIASILCYDPELFVTTPTSVLASSAMNGFNKGIETIYSRRTNPISTGHAVQGLGHFRLGLPTLCDRDLSDGAIDNAVAGIILVQYGRFTNIIHTFGNGISYNHDVQQGTVHGIMAPAVLRYVFEQTDASRRQIADALDIDHAGLDDGAVADDIVTVVTEIRDALGLPSTLRSIPDLDRSDLDTLADAIVANHKHARNPPGVDPDVAAIRSILDEAY